VTVDWELPSEGAVPKLRLIWTETGGPPVQRGFGSRLIERSARDQLGGEATVDFLPRRVWSTPSLARCTRRVRERPNLEETDVLRIELVLRSPLWPIAAVPVALSDVCSRGTNGHQSELSRLLFLTRSGLRPISFSVARCRKRVIGLQRR
jgi:hypothetical protein